VSFFAILFPWHLFPLPHYHTCPLFVSSASLFFHTSFHFVIPSYHHSPFIICIISTPFASCTRTIVVSAGFPCN
jgi:hypothetical protein